MSAVSDVAAEPLRRLVGPEATVGVLPNGIDVARWAVGPVTREPGPLRLVTAMRLAARKRPAALVELVAEAEAAEAAEEPAFVATVAPEAAPAAPAALPAPRQA